MKTNHVYFKNSQNMGEIPDARVDLALTSPPYFNVKDYAKDGYQKRAHSARQNGQIGDIADYELFIKELAKVWAECERALKPNGKLIVNAPLMPMQKKEYSTHYNRHIFDLNADIQRSILTLPKTRMFLYDTYIWNRNNGSKGLMFGSYPYPRNFYAQNTSEFVSVYVKDGVPHNSMPKSVKEESKLTEEEWRNYTKQIWDIPAPNKKDLAFGKHSAIMPEEIVRRCVRMFTYAGDVVLDPFAGSGTTLKVAKELGRQYIGYEIMTSYRGVIRAKLLSTPQLIAGRENHVCAKQN
ncbi:MAG: DNA-methyltransferase [Gammaproteobacteria bacterium]